MYVPDTLGKCIFTSNYTSYMCYTESVVRFVKITNDPNWICLLIWQHTQSSECNKKEGFICKGTIPSGTARQIDEGKKYTSDAWSLSMINGRIMLNKAPSYRFVIHNCLNQ